jgi:hypothetical protein
MSACDDESAGSGQGAANNGATNNGATNNGATNNGATNNGATNNGATNNGVTNNGSSECNPPCEDGFVCVPPGECVREQECDPGEISGCVSATARRVCNEEGSAFFEDPCPEDAPNCLAGECTSDICIPGETVCIDRDTEAVCDEEGEGYSDERPCPEGSLCVNGRCLSGCDLSEKFPSYIGCKYWSLDLDQYNDPFGDPSAVPHAVVISNPSDREATVTIRTDNQSVTPTPSEVQVPAGGVEVYTFPRLDVDGTGISDRAFFLQSSWPVVMYQFNPLNNEGVASNDASLLLPSESLGREYVAMSWPTTPIPEILMLPPQHGYITLVAVRPGRTHITLELSADVGGGSNVPFMEAGTIQTFTLRQGQVLNLEADGSDLFGGLQDLTGTTILADQPIAVFGGHEEAVVGDGCCAEHLEQQLFPFESWGQLYLAVQSETRGGSQDVWRVVAARDNTIVETVPPQANAGSFTLNRGEWREIQTGQSFEITANQPVMVGQYLQSQELTGDGIGDPAFILAVPIERLRDNYTVLTPADYAEDWLTIIRPAGAAITFDGQPVTAPFVTFGSGEWEYTWLPVQDGVHSVEAAVPFALVAYGFSAAVSYGYPGGLNLRVVE